MMRPYGIDVVDPAEYVKNNYKEAYSGNSHFNFNINIPFKKFFEGFSIDFLLNDVNIDSASTREKFMDNMNKGGWFSINHEDQTVVRYDFSKNAGSTSGSMIRITRDTGHSTLETLKIHSASWKNGTPPTLIDGNYTKGISRIIAEYIERKNGKAIKT
ncbi:hypothetical protein HYU07_03430 [Candidatus Woesearchaeota archaeon]|nr:hypothetical protein [Candidatus Woesearchaeota archaeon]